MPRTYPKRAASVLPADVLALPTAQAVAWARSHHVVISEAQVTREREIRGIPHPARTFLSSARDRIRRATDDDLRAPLDVLARRYGCSTGTVSRERASRGIVVPTGVWAERHRRGLTRTAHLSPLAHEPEPAPAIGMTPEVQRERIAEIQRPRRLTPSEAAYERFLNARPSYDAENP